MSFLGKLWNGIKTGAKGLWNAFTGGLTNGLGSIASSGINYLSQADANASNERQVASTNQANKEIAESTNSANMAMNRENIAMQQQENEITRQREDNAVQRRAEDMQKAGLSKTLAAGSAASANAMQAPANSMSMQPYQMQAFRKEAYKADLSAMNYQVNQNKSLELQNDYQSLVNKYFEKHGQLPPTADSNWIISVVKELFPGIADKISGMIDSGIAGVNNFVSDVADKVSGTIDKAKNQSNLPTADEKGAQAIYNAFDYIGTWSDDHKSFKFNDNVSDEDAKRCLRTLYNYANHGILDKDNYYELLDAFKKHFGDRFTYNW